MDDARIEAIRRAVMDRLGGGSAAEPPGSLEARVSALEAAVSGLVRGGAPALGSAPAVRGRTHPSLLVVTLPPNAEAGLGEPGRCVMEPDKPCVQSHACRTFGH